MSMIATGAYRGAILRFSPHDGHAIWEEDGLLVTGTGRQGVEVVLDVGSYEDISPQWAELPFEEFNNRIIAPGFIDLHAHYPQTNIIGSPATGLLPWLERYTFAEESRFTDLDYCTESAQFFIEELLRNGVTTALVFSTSHAQSVNALFDQALVHGLRLITGLCLMDRNAPSALCNSPAPDGSRNAAMQSVFQSEELLNRWHGVNRLGYAITPRFAPSCSDLQMQAAGELAARYPQVWIQTHVAENHAEVAWVHELFPDARSYLAVYDAYGLLRPRSIYAHCLHLDTADWALMARRGAAAAVCPTSNLFLGSGFFDFEQARQAGLRFGLASDVGAGTSFSPFRTMLAAYTVARAVVPPKTPCTLTPQQLWWQHTAGAAQALGLDGTRLTSSVGNLNPGCDADFIVLDPKATPLLARKWACAQTLDEKLFSLIVLGDDRVIEHTHVAKLQSPPVAHPAQ